VTIAADGIEALACVNRHHPDLILLDLNIPLLDGFEVCRRLKRGPATRLIPIIIITGEAVREAKLRAWELGADEFLTKPFHCVEVVARCQSLLRVKGLVDELDSAEAVVFALARTVEAKSPYTKGHSDRVTYYAVALAEKLGLVDDDLALLRKGAMLHDIGKISVPDAILDKPGLLTDEEYEVVKLHTVQGARILEPLQSMRSVVPFVRSHHERIDGQGYPDRLAGEEIPLLVRILSIADIYDSLASARPYRAAIPHEACLEILRKTAREGGLDEELVQVFCATVAKGVPEDLPSEDVVRPARSESPDLSLSRPGNRRRISPAGTRSTPFGRAC
jgi:putative two-component system response regulator